MKKCKKRFSLILSVAILFTTCFSGITLEAKAAEPDNYGDYFGISDGSGAGIGREDTLTESWENGLDLDKWEVVKYDNSYVSDFQVVDDPVNGSNQGKVLTTDRAGAWLMPTDHYYPNGTLWGELKTIEYKVYFKGIKSRVNGTSGQRNEYCPGVSFRVVTDDKTGETLARRVDGYLAYTGISDTKSGIEVDGAYFRGDSMNGIDGLSTFGYITPSYQIQTENYTANFDFSNWIQVQITVDKEGNAVGTFTDCSGLTYSANCGKYNQSGGKFALGYMPRNIYAKNYVVSEQDWGGQLYLDDIKVTFQPSDFDKDENVGDVDVYYEGNTYLKAGETVSLTGERLGSSVLSAKLSRLTDTEVSIENAKYVEETHYDAYYDVDANAVWNQLNKGEVLSSTEVDGAFCINQRSELGLNMIIPKSLGDGMYAILLEAADPDGKDELVIINNPRITLLMGDDGDCATFGGWLKLGGENLSVQDDMSKVSAIILDENGQKLYLIQNTPAHPKRIYVDTTENYGAENEHYMQVSLEGLSLEDGKTYQIMVHNGYGGDYGWSMPKEFSVQKEAANTEWRKKGVFNVLDYGAVGDGEANDTAAIQRAINAAVANGGGTVYFPKRANGDTGYYRITNGLLVKENISLVGDGPDYTKMYYDGYLKTTAEQTEYMISYERNFEITGMELFCNTNYFSAAIKKSEIAKGKQGKLYIHDIKLYFDATAWRNNSFSPTLPEYEGKTSSEWYEIQWMNRKKWFIQGSKSQSDVSETFISYHNVEQDLRSCGLANNLSGDYLDISDYRDEFDHAGGGMGLIQGTKAAFEENAYTSLMKSNTLYRSPIVINTNCNNREVFLCDTGGVNTIRQIRYIDPDTVENELSVLLSSWDAASIQELKTLAGGEAKGRVFYSSGSLNAGDTIAITDGEQGVGQIREVEQVVIINKTYFIIVDTEFACNPNRNSSASRITGKPNHTYVCNGDFQDGTCVMVYGLSYDTVFNGCNLKNIGTVGYGAHYSGFCWYGTLKNIKLDGTDYVHNDKPGEQGKFFLDNGESIQGVVFLGMRYANSSIRTNEGKLQLIRGNTARKYNAYNLVVEDLEIISEQAVITLDSIGAGGMFIKNVRQYADATNKAYSEISPYRDASVARTALKNENLWADNLLPAWTQMKGDINRDDVVSQKDLELLREYLAGMREFNADEIKVANMNVDYNDSDAVIDARDFLYLRAVIKYRDDEEALRVAIGEIGKTKVKNKDKNFNVILDYDKADEED